MLHLNVPPEKIVDTIRERILSSFMALHNIGCRQRAQELLLKSEKCSDWYITKKDVQNLKAKTDATSWRRHPNAAISVDLFYQSLPEEHKLLFQPQCPKEGTPDHQFFHQSPSPSQPGGSLAHALYGDPEHTQDPSIPSEEEEEEDEESPTPNPAPEEKSEHEDPTQPRPGPPPNVPVYRDGAEVFKYDFNNWTDFRLAFMHKSLLDFAVASHGQPLMMDSTFGTNNLGFPLTTIHAVDGHGNAHPLAACILSRETIEGLCEFLQAFLNKVCSHA